MQPQTDKERLANRASRGAFADDSYVSPTTRDWAALLVLGKKTGGRSLTQCRPLVWEHK